jgi:tetratricopeptide (TPR) repeat protein
MGDPGTGAPESVIDMSRRQRRPRPHGAPPPAPALPPEDAGPVEDYLSLPFLMERVESELEPVRMWAAYHLLDRWPEACAQFIEPLWRSPTLEIRESAIQLIGRYGLESYAFPLLRVFLADPGALSVSAAQALGRLHYEPATRLLAQRFEAALGAPETNALAIEGLAESLLIHDGPANWPLIHGRLSICLGNHQIYSALFRLLCRHAGTDEQLRLLAQAYREPREAFHDAHLTQHLVSLVSRPELCRYLHARLNGGFPLNAVYLECLPVLGLEPDAETLELINGLAQCRNSRAGMERFFTLAYPLLERLVPEPEMAASFSAFLRGCQDWVPRWEESILKVREAETHLIFSVPLAAALLRAERDCLSRPDAEALRITRIYQSPLLSPDFMASVLELVAGHPGRAEAPAFGGGEFRPAAMGALRDEEKDALWKLFTHRLDELDYPFDQVLPQPWALPMPGLMERLTQVLERRLPSYLSSGRAQTVDYCLEVFRRSRGRPPIDLLLNHFDALINRHYHACVELMNHLPDPRFLPGLVHHYRQGEQDLQQLIRFVCDVHGRPYPQAIAAADQPPAAALGPTLPRLACAACGGTYPYDLPALFVDEERIEQRQIPQARDLWAPAPILCKKCGAGVALDPDERFLNELYAELVALRLFRMTGEDGPALKAIHAISFPTLDGKTCNPAEFLPQVLSRLTQGVDPARDLALLLELGRFHLEVGNLKDAKQVFQRVLAGPVRYPAALYYLGVIAFQEKNLYEARVYFSRLTQSYVRADCEDTLDNPVDMAHHYLKLLDKREFKRSHFHLLAPAPQGGF